MAMSSLIVHWLSHLAKSGIIRKGENLLEFGPQDMITPRKIIEGVAYKHLGNDANTVIEDIFEGEKPKPLYQKHFYSIFGFSKYESLDYFDKRADYKYDLNYVFDPDTERKYDLNYARAPYEKYFAVTNFGTAEHCFNIAASFHTAHSFLKVGGIFLYVLPAFGDINHGFFNIHPNVYVGLARYNKYDVLDFRYVDDIGGKTNFVNQRDYKPFDFNELPIKFDDIITDRIREKSIQIFIKNVLSREIKSLEDRVYDYCFVALRKTVEQPFRFPSQY